MTNGSVAVWHDLVGISRLGYTRPAMIASRVELRFAIIALAVFFLAIASGELLRYLPSRVATPLWKTVWIGLCFLGLFLAHRMGPVAALGELGLHESLWPGVWIALLASLPMLLAFAFTAKVNPDLSLGHTLKVAALGPFAEEVLFRGYLFRQLYRRAGWGFLSAVGVTAGLFGSAHLRNVLGEGNIWQVLGEVAITGAGGAFFAWLFIKWRDNLWVPVAMHGFMNVWWEVFAIDRTAVGGWLANGARLVTVVAAIAITRYWVVGRR